MTGRILQLLLGVVIFICSTPQGMAQKTISEGIRADFFAAASDDEAIGADDSSGYEFGGEDGKRAAASFGDLGLPPSLLGVEESESSVESESESEAKRTQKRAPSQKIFQNKCRILECLSAERMSKGVAKHPATQDAGQERTAAIRFLQDAALVC